MNKSNIMLTEKDIVTFSDDQELLDEFDLSIEIHSRFDDAKQIKQRILDNQEIVQRLKERINTKKLELDIISVTHTKNGSGSDYHLKVLKEFNDLKSILENKP